MTIPHMLRSARAKVLTAVVAAFTIIGATKAYAAYHDADCCAAGAACCHPGAACCHGHKAS